MLTSLSKWRQQGFDMAMRCKRCGGLATAGAIPWEEGRGWCLACSSAASLEIPATKERRAAAPAEMVEGPVWGMTREAGAGGELWLHQAEALGALNRGENVVVATSTASGKSMVFQAWTLHGIKASPEPTTLVFYPTKALANDQERRWLEACELVGLPRETVGKINGDVAVNQRDPIISRARVVIMTPDVCHAWMTRRSDSQAVRGFLAKLRNVIIDEAHVYEDVFGSNAAYLFRRLAIAAVNAGNPRPPQFVAATATIRSPEDHMRKLTGLEFAVVDESRNGSPRHPRKLLHLPLQVRQGTAEEQLAALVSSIIENDPDAQVIAFQDSRQGIERVARLIDRPDVLPYRSGYNPEDRRRIEEKLQKNQIRAVIATSALELGIDMPDLNYGVNLYLPQSRKQLLQRIGRVGRSRPGTFVILASDDQFAQHGETMEAYFQEAVEPSNLYLDNEYIAFQQALCMVEEMRAQNVDAMSPPSQCAWPTGFAEALRNAHGRAPRHLEDVLQRTAQTEPHLAYGLRNSGEEKLAIHEAEPDSRARVRKIEEIEVSVAMREAYPGAVYHHQGRTYTVRRWGRDRETRAPYINMVPAKGLGGARTKPVSRHVITTGSGREHVVDRRRNVRRRGEISQAKLTVTESVEGYQDHKGQLQLYHRLQASDPNRSRKQWDFPTSGVHIRISQPWFDGDSGEAWEARHQVADALKAHLAYRRSVAPADISTAVDNVFVQTPKGFLLSTDSVVVYDNVYGGLGLTEALWWSLEEYAKQLLLGADRERRRWNRIAVSPENARRLVRWLDEENDQPEPLPEEPGPNSWWRIIRPGSQVRLYQHDVDDLAEGTLVEPVWQDGIKYAVEFAGQGRTLAADEQLLPQGSALDWQVWQPSTGREQELQAEDIF